MVGKVQTAGLVLLGLELACGFLHAPVLQQKVVSSRQSAISSAYVKPSAGMARADKWRLRAEGEDAEPASSDEAAAPAASNPVDDVFNSVPFLQKRKQALEKEKASILENLELLKDQYKVLEEEWGSQLASIRKDYDTLKGRYLNDTVESQNTGRSTVFVELLATVDDFERAKMAYKCQTPEEQEIVDAYSAVKDSIVQAMLSSGMEEVPTVGTTFDFKMHDCMFTEASMEYEEDIITREFAKGFMIGGKCVRPAKVATSLGPGPN